MRDLVHSFDNLVLFNPEEVTIFEVARRAFGDGFLDLQHVLPSNIHSDDPNGYTLFCHLVACALSDLLIERGLPVRMASGTFGGEAGVCHSWITLPSGAVIDAHIEGVGAYAPTTQPVLWRAYLANRLYQEAPEALEARLKTLRGSSAHTQALRELTVFFERNLSREV